MDISTPFGEAMLEILAVFGKLETRIRQSRQRAGIEARRDSEPKRCPWGGRRAGTRIKVTVEDVRDNTTIDLSKLLAGIEPADFLPTNN